MSSFKKISNRFLMLGKNFQNLTFFLLERDLFHEIDQIFIKIFGKVVFYLKIFKLISNVRAVFQQFESQNPAGGLRSSY